MRTIIAVRPARRVLHLGLMCALAVGAAGCSSDTTRFGENPNGSPYAAPPPNQVSAAPAPSQVAAVQRQNLPPPQYAQSQYAPPPQYPPSQYAPTQAAAQPQYAPPPAAPHAVPEVTGAVHNGGYWDAEGGTAVVVAQGETVDIIARRWNIPSRAILQANNITHPNA